MLGTETPEELVNHYQKLYSEALREERRLKPAYDAAKKEITRDGILDSLAAVMGSNSAENTISIYDSIYRRVQHAGEHLEEAEKLLRQSEKKGRLERAASKTSEDSKGVEATVSQIAGIISIISFLFVIVTASKISANVVGISLTNNLDISFLFIGIIFLVIFWITKR